jgi:hypothetical protein
VHDHTRAQATGEWGVRLFTNTIVKFIARLYRFFTKKTVALQNNGIHY